MCFANIKFQIVCVYNSINVLIKRGYRRGKRYRNWPRNQWDKYSVASSLHGIDANYSHQFSYSNVFVSIWLKKNKIHIKRHIFQKQCLHNSKHKLIRYFFLLQMRQERGGGYTLNVIEKLTILCPINFPVTKHLCDLPN